MHWCYCRTLPDDLSAGHGLHWLQDLHCSWFWPYPWRKSPTKKMIQKTNPLEASQASMRKVRFINDAVPLAIFSWNDWEVPEQRQSAGVWWNKARPSTNHQLASDFQGGKAQQNSIMLQVFWGRASYFPNEKTVVSSIWQWEGKGEQNFLQAIKGARKIERLLRSRSHLTFCIVLLQDKWKRHAMDVLEQWSSE